MVAVGTRLQITFCLDRAMMASAIPDIVDYHRRKAGRELLARAEKAGLTDDQLGVERSRVWWMKPAPAGSDALLVDCEANDPDRTLRFQTLTRLVIETKGDS